MSSSGITGKGLLQTGINAFDPANIFGHSGSSVLKNLIDPGNIDSGPDGLNLFGDRPTVTPGGPSTLPTLDGPNAAAGLSGNFAPQFFQSNPTPYQQAPSPGAGMMNFNNMAQQLAGPQYGFGTFSPSQDMLGSGAGVMGGAANNLGNVSNTPGNMTVPQMPGNMGGLNGGPSGTVGTVNSGAGMPSGAMPTSPMQLSPAQLSHAGFGTGIVPIPGGPIHQGPMRPENSINTSHLVMPQQNMGAFGLHRMFQGPNQPMMRRPSGPFRSRGGGYL